MSIPTPSGSAVVRCRDFLRSMSAARQVYTLYPDGHPNRRDVISTLLDDARGLRDATPGDRPVLFVTRHSFYLGPTLLARESLSLYRLVEAFERAEIEALELLGNVDEDSLDGLVRIINEEQSLSNRPDGLAINRIRPELGDEREEGHRSELRRGYAQGLEVLRDAAVRASAGRPVDLEATTTVVDDLAEQVMLDPAQALLLTTVKSYDEYTYYHMMNVCLLSIALGYSVGLRRDQIVSLGMGALLHDVGKLSVPEDVLSHVGPLTSEQWRLVQRHPVEGAGLVFGTQSGLYHPAATVVLEHHAAYNLSGYPKLSGRPLPSPPARLVSVADCFDAVTSKRSYRAAEERRQALNILIAGSGRGFDPHIVRIFVRLLGVYPVGSLVKLDSGETGVVLRNHEALLARPTVRLVLDANDNPCEPDTVDLSEQARGEGFRHNVVGSIDPDDLGIDVTTLVATGRIEPPAEADGDAGLVHEPSHGERPPPGYVDTHNPGADGAPSGSGGPGDTSGHAPGHTHGHDHGDHGGGPPTGPDPDVAPPIGEDDLKGGQ